MSVESSSSAESFATRAEVESFIAFYSAERLFSVEARRQWLEPDLRPLD